MKKLLLLISVVIAGMGMMTSCDSTETYADKRDKEDAAIGKFLARNSMLSKSMMSKPITVISEETFKANGCQTDTAKNEYVLFSSEGVYMQVINLGSGETIKNGETMTLLCRFIEGNILGDSLQLSNDILDYAYICDKMTVKNTSGTFSGTFVENESLMYAAYSSASVPSGWLLPLRYLKPGRLAKETDRLAEVRLIVPAAQGQYYASSNVYPCFYCLSYQRGR